MAEKPNHILVDAHVHIYPCYDLDNFFNSAYNNFMNASVDEYGTLNDFTGILCLTEGNNENAFDLLSQYGMKGKTTKMDTKQVQWSLQQTKEEISLHVSLNARKKLFIISGRQIATRENLEVLALGTRKKFDDGQTIGDIINRVVQDGAVPVIPWGFGKWTGKRAKILEKLVMSSSTPNFFLGDNGNRPAFWFRPDFFRKAESAGIRNLPGSDPLPFQTECQRPGSFGIRIHGALNPDLPAQDLKDKLLDASTEIKPFGAGEKFIRFVRNQSGMQYFKYIRKKFN